jgi:hypothetical protein
VKTKGNRSAYLVVVNMNFATIKDDLGEIHIALDSCNRKYVRISNDAMNEILPDAPEAESGW